MSSSERGESPPAQQQAQQQQPKINHRTTVAKTKWLELQTIDYTDQEGKDRKWDVVTRTTKQKSAAADAVIIIPLLKRCNDNDNDDNDDDDAFDTILVEQFQAWVILYGVRVRGSVRGPLRIAVNRTAVP